MFGALDDATCTAYVQLFFSLDDACELFSSNGTLVLNVTEASVDWSATDTDGNGIISSLDFHPANIIDNIEHLSGC
ncbi:MAG: hypothetical protein R2795_08870 [Saprospiraceae bacterium]